MCEINNWTVYILLCNDKSFYTGITNNIEKRIEKHNNGTGARYTKYRTPVSLLDKIDNLTKSEASKLEYKIKQQPKHKKIEILNMNKKFNMDENREKAKKHIEDPKITIEEKCHRICSAFYIARHITMDEEFIQYLIKQIDKTFRVDENFN